MCYPSVGSAEVQAHRLRVASQPAWVPVSDRPPGLRRPLQSRRGRPAAVKGGDGSMVAGCGGRRVLLAGGAPGLSCVSVCAVQRSVRVQASCRGRPGPAGSDVAAASTFAFRGGRSCVALAFRGGRSCVAFAFHGGEEFGGPLVGLQRAVLFVLRPPDLPEPGVPGQHALATLAIDSWCSADERRTSAPK
eukprot:CAMPEP_0204403282 /NCGR_PEP_ID=MMETSP0470-20130426/5759_1 /ASSEMBLY_ACC=CAM_ASM_000385 /TAXON_ID=2969 /ORGANISM="Oxyrrhis marina" /LENGTH=189 /DNA_ID=CAMNT_0051398403 /DNA_START=272 /DNA_END=839 /DNA_ORIENTATION=+